MELILDILYIYVAVYSLYFMALAIRNLNDRPFKIEKRYSQYEEKDNIAVVIYARNNKITLENLIKELIKKIVLFTNNYEKKKVLEISSSKWL